MKIAIGNDHAAVELKKTIMEYVESMGHEVTNFGTDSSESCNYPEYGEKVANAVASGEFDCGILICGTGVGISIAANKVNGIRAAGWCGRGGSADLCIQALLCRTAGAERTKRYSGRVTCSDREKRTPSNKSGGYFYDEDRSDRTGCCEH